MSTEEVNATSAAKELAEAEGVDLTDVEGTGTDGKVTVNDVRAYLGEEAGDPDPEASNGGAVAEAGELSEDAPEGPKPTEQFPPATNLDVDVADLDKGPKDDEHPPLVLAGYWVRLGTTDAVPERYHGLIAQIVESPWTPVPFAFDSEEEIHGYRFDPDKKFLVKAKGEGEALLEVEPDDVLSYSDSRATLLNFA